ncbi:MAG: hypothetical protein V7643_986 [Mycobacterium sp.]|jgi:hypothetical protein
MVTDGTGLRIPKALESAIDAAVTRHLESELRSRGFLLNSVDLAVAETRTASLGRALMTRLLKQCYPEADGLAVEFERTSDMARISAALAFGAATSRVLASTVDDWSRPVAVVELLCGSFNLAIGLVDSLCDTDAAIGEQLLAHFRDADLMGAAVNRRGPGWLRARMPLFLAADDGVAFTVGVTEAFFENLHELYADKADVRHTVGEQLTDALEAEAGSVRRPLNALTCEREIEWSRATSVLPFEIIETLTNAGRPPATPSSGTLLGEAMWRIDDLVDLIDDARSGALNALLLKTLQRRGPHDGYEVADLQAVLTSSGIASAAVEATECLRHGLGVERLVRSDDQRTFLQFVQRYAAIEPTS